MAFDFSPQPHEEAMALIRDKPTVTRRVFDQLLPELRGRAFTVTGIEAASTLQRLRDSIAELPAGKTWNEVKEQMLPDISPYFGEDPEGADRRADLLLRTHGFQAFQASNWRVAQEDGDTTHLQYLATEDTHVRESHLALNGLIIDKNDPFWQTHFPPWDWGCRCRVAPINPDLLDEARKEDETRNPDNQLVMEGPALRKLREGTLIRDGQVFDVTAPSESNKENAYVWHPDNLRLSPKELEGRYDAETWKTFKEFALNQKLAGTGDAAVTVWDWLNGVKLVPAPGKFTPPPSIEPPTPSGTPSPGDPAAGSLEQTLNTIGMNSARVTADQVSKLWEEMKEENPVRASEKVVAFNVRKTGVLSQKNVEANFNELLSRLPRAVVEKLPDITVRVNSEPGALGSYNPFTNVLSLSPKLAKSAEGARSTLFHEMMHWVHIHGPEGYAEEIKKHFEARTAGESIQALPGYSGSTVGKQDKWWEAYAGRVYGGSMKAVEATRMGLEVPTRYIQILAKSPDKVADHWNTPEDRETLRVVLGIFFGQ